MTPMSTNIAPIVEVELISAGQIGRASDRFSERCRTNASSLPRDMVQAVLEDEGDQLAQEMFQTLRARVERRLNMIVRKVTVDRNRTPEEVLKATGRKQYVTDSVVSAMPKGEGDEVEVYFFKLGRFVSDADLDKEYELRGLKPADTYSQAAVNEADPAFGDEHPNATHWKDADGKWCFSTFYGWYDERFVNVGRSGSDWSDDWWFAGLRKS
jgi:hypothetical protein